MRVHEQPHCLAETKEACPKDTHAKGKSTSSLVVSARYWNRVLFIPEQYLISIGKTPDEENKTAQVPPVSYTTMIVILHLKELA